MKVVQINDLCNAGSIGKISVFLSKWLSAEGIENYIFYSDGYTDYDLAVKYTNKLYIKAQALKSRVFGNYGFNSKLATRRLVSKLQEIAPDIIHLHNLHGHNVNLEIFFEYAKNNNIKLIWTFHDCWAMTGYCPHFTMANCSKWTTHCKDCEQRKNYSWFFDKSSELQERKEKCFSGLDLTIITPSQWMSNVVKQSFLKEYPVEVVNNGINLNIFKKVETDFRKKYNCENKFIILGVSFGWSKRKGLDVFIQLSQQLSEDYQIVLVGTDESIDSFLPKNIISIHKTHNQEELAEIYSAADIFFNPTREDTFPTVNMEAIACETPVLSFDIGGSNETILPGCGCVIKDFSIEEIKKNIYDMKEKINKYSLNCKENRGLYNENERIKGYYKFYEKN